MTTDDRERRARKAVHAALTGPLACESLSWLRGAADSEHGGLCDRLTAAMLAFADGEVAESPIHRWEQRGHNMGDGWLLLAMHDPAGRRGLWYRVVGNAVEMCSGREGDDAFASLSSSPELLEVLEYARAVVEPLESPAAPALEPRAVRGQKGKR